MKTAKYKLLYRKYARTVLGFLVLIIGLLNLLLIPNGSGGYYLRPLYYVLVLVCALQFGFRGGLAAAAAVSLMYSPQQLLVFGMPNPEQLMDLGDTAGFFVVAVLTGSIADRRKSIHKKLLDQFLTVSFQNSYSQSIMQSIRSGVIAANRELLITAMNSGARDILDTRGVEGDSLRSIFYEHPGLLAKLENALERSQTTEGLELSLQTPGGRTKTITISMFPLIYDGIRRGVVIILDDITELKNLREHMLRSEKLSALGVLYSGIAHEIRNPLGIIKAIEETLRRELKNNTEAVKQLEMIDEEVERANRALNSRLNTAKPGSGVKRRVLLSEVIRDTLAVMGTYLEQRQVSALYKDISAAAVQGDPERLKQALVNLVFNSVQAMPGGGSITITTEGMIDGRAKLAVVDTGKGIDPNHIPLVFDPFFTTRPDGAGLGLSIVHQIVDEHGGIITLTSQVDQGTRVEIIFPADREVSGIG
ncbi:MAG: hypothetical protein HPY50_06110 [Firmicutes bacterium]|nr:hypothetical protein [Bacillota bacterium]